MNRFTDELRELGELSEIQELRLMMKVQRTGSVTRFHVHVADQFDREFQPYAASIRVRGRYSLSRQRL